MKNAGLYVRPIDSRNHLHHNSANPLHCKKVYYTLVNNAKQAEISVLMAHAGRSNISTGNTEWLSYSNSQIAALLIKPDFALVFMMLVAMVTMTANNFHPEQHILKFRNVFLHITC